MLKNNMEQKIDYLKKKVFNRTFFLVLFGVLFGIWLSTITSQNSLFSIKSFIDSLRVYQLDTSNSSKSSATYDPKISYEQAIINAVKNTSSSVVSITISKNVPVYKQEMVNPFGDNSPFNFSIPQYVQKGTELQKVGAGSGFIVSKDGIVVTNKHVVIDKTAQYSAYTNDGKKFSAKVLAIDPVQDVAVIKIDANQEFTPVNFGDSSSLQIGQSVIVIGNALGQFQNTVSVGVVSGLGRTISASDQGGSFSEILEGIIQTDAAINAGNSGGPLLDLNGHVIGINTAMAEGGQNIGFAIPINIAKRAIQQVLENNKITYPFLGVRYVIINEDVKQQYKLSVDQGAFIIGGNSSPAVTKGAAADKAGVKEKDIILEINGEKITQNNSLSKIIMKYNPKDEISLKILRDSKEIMLKVVLGERSE